MSDIFEEVEEGLREDRATRLWQRYRWLIIGVAATLVLGTLIREVVVYQNARSQTSEAEAFDVAYRAFEDGNYAEAQSLLSEIVDDGGRFSELAGHFLAQAQLAGSGDEAAAQAALLAAADGDTAFGRLALLKAGYIAADSSTVAELETMLQPLVANGGRYGALAREIIAARAWEVGEVQQARDAFQTLQFALDAPRGVQERAAEAIAVIDSRALLEASQTTSNEPEATETNSEEVE